MKKERRDSYRFEVVDGNVQLCILPDYPEAKILDLSASGGSLEIPARLVETLTEAPVILHAGQYPAFRTQLVPVHSSEAGGLAKIGVLLEQLDHTALKSLSRFLIDRFRRQAAMFSYPGSAARLSIANFRRDLVCNLLMFHAISNRRIMRVYHGSLLLPLLLRARELTVEAARQLIVAEVLAGTTDILEQDREYTFAFPGSNALNYFKSAIWRNEPGRLLVMLPPDIRQSGFRDSFRTRLMAGPVLEAIFEHPRLSGYHLTKNVLDVSARGCSFPLEPKQDMLCPGERIKRLALHLPEGPVWAEAAVRSIIPRGDFNGLACGVELVDFQTKEQAERWRRFVFHASHLRLKLGERASVPKAWDVLESSGYVALTKENTRPRLKKRFFVSWEQHAERPQVSRFFLLFKGDRPVGTAAASLLYPDTWMAHHFGIDERERKEDKQRLFDFAQEIYSGIMFMLRHMISLEHFLFYFDEAKAFHEKAFGQFLRRYPVKEDFIYDGFKLFICNLPLGLDRPGFDRDQLRIVCDEPRLLRLLSRHQEAHLPAIEFEAYHYSEEEIDLEVFSRECAANGYERERRIFFAVDGDDPLAALIAETGEEGINIFSLLNTCWFAYMKPEAAQNFQIKARLLQEAIGYYTGKGKRSFLLLGSTDEPMDLIGSLGFTYLADGLRWLGRRAIVPAYVNYFEDLMGMIRNSGR